MSEFIQNSNYSFPVSNVKANVGTHMWYILRQIKQVFPLWNGIWF